MLSIIIAFPKIDDANKIKNILIRNGYEVEFTCNSAAQVIDMANKLDGGIVLCGYRLTDMLYLELYNYLPSGFSMILMASQTKLETCYENEISQIPMPLKINEMLNALEKASYKYRKKHKRNSMPKVRSDEEKNIIGEAKQLLIINKGMNEEEAHKYIQKISMDSGNNMVETAEMILLLK